MCRVNNCPDKHRKHYCRYCKEEDSSHFAHDCPYTANKQVSHQTFVPKNPFTNSKCRVNACTQNHEQHYCSVCHDKDSSHFAHNCPNQGRRGYEQKNGCKVKGCPDNHHEHYCCICHDKDSSHYARNCPKGITVYHGTANQFGDAIEKGGFKPSKDGRIGPGVYFTDDPNIAWQIAKNRAQHYHGQPVVIQTRIPKDKAITQQAQHPTWDKVTQLPFKELKVNKQKRVRVRTTLADDR